ncbi:MAG: TPM domain-containing protein [Thermaurantimonas sp.]|uniref:TPM domain-containing protein n=1 Tax=Thermaurantimonas sp. TaxID=2681568 RepID=UPI00391D46F5
MTNWRKFWIASLLLIFSALSLSASKRPIPKYRAPVNDFTGAFLAPKEAQRLSQELIAFEDSTGIQIAVCIEPSLEGESAFDRSLAIARAWGPGSKEANSGILIYIALEDRAIFIQTGYGAEGFLPDAIAKRIVEQIMKPYFQQGRFYEGLRLAIEAIKTRGAEENFPKIGNKKGEDEIPGWVIILIILVVLYLVARNPGRGGGISGGGPVIFPPVGRGGGGFSGWGGSSGGWGGFGGGGFGGGGAGGRW